MKLHELFELEKTQERLRKLGYPEKKKGPFGLGPKTPVKESAGAPGISDEDMKLLKTAAKLHGDVTHQETWKGKYSHFELDGYGWNPLTHKKNADELAKKVGLSGDFSNSTPREITLAVLAHKKTKKGSK